MRYRPDCPAAETLPMSDIAVILPHFADTARLQRCLSVLTAQDLDGVEVVVVDNATPGGIAGIAAMFPQIAIITEPQKGAAAARNRGVTETRAPWLAFLDADCVPEADWLGQVRRITGGDLRSVTGGRVDVFDETPQPRSGAEAFETVFAFDQAGYIRDKGFSVTANLITSRATFEATGPFVVGVSEDLEWCRRATAAGHRLVYDADLAVSHPTRSDWPALAKKWRRLTAEEFGLQQGRMRWIAKALAMPISALAHAPRVLSHPALTRHEKARALVTLVRLRSARMVWMLSRLGS